MRQILGIFLATLFFVPQLLISAEKQAVYPPDARRDFPFTPGIMVGDTLYVSGQTGPDPKTGKFPQDFEQEVRNTLDNIGRILKAAGMDFSDVVSVQVFLTDMSLFPRMNKVYVTYFPDPKPARTTVGVADLVGDARIEINAIAVRR